MQQLFSKIFTFHSQGDKTPADFAERKRFNPVNRLPRNPAGGGNLRIGERLAGLTRFQHRVKPAVDRGGLFRIWLHLLLSLKVQAEGGGRTSAKYILGCLARPSCKRAARSH